MLMRFVLASLIFLVVNNAAPLASAQEPQGSRMSRDEAREYMTAYFAERPRVSVCSPAGSANYRRATAVAFGDARITITCQNGEQHDVAFADAPNAAGHAVRPSPWEVHRWVYVTGTGVIHDFQGMDDEHRFVEAWAALQREPPLDPATDAAFQSSLQTARARGTDRSEDQRRAQVRAEAFIAEGRLVDALEVYQTALQSSPDWANGHYNAALVAAELEQHARAINAMRRYLYLAPEASDARAVQDQIYRWEAALE
jgi:tetratricopeptide (TPR) repeat protein